MTLAIMSAELWLSSSNLPQPLYSLSGVPQKSQPHRHYSSDIDGIEGTVSMSETTREELSDADRQISIVPSRLYSRLK